MDPWWIVSKYLWESRGTDTDCLRNDDGVKTSPRVCRVKCGP